jgi:hypothetical protein
VRLIYLDETGISAKESIAVVAGVIIDADSQWTRVAERIRDIIKEFVPEQKRQDNFVFHAKDLFHGTGRSVFDRRLFPLDRAREALIEVLRIPTAFRLPVIYGYIDKRVFDARPPLDLRPHEQEQFNHSLAFCLCALSAEAFMREFAGPDEIATIHAENNNTTHKAVRQMRRVLSGKSKHTELFGATLSERARQYIPIRRIVDEIGFYDKDDAFLLQIADACALILRFALEGKENCEPFFDSLTNGHRDLLQPAQSSGDFNMLYFEEVA